jgi:hypothetical protein
MPEASTMGTNLMHRQMSASTFTMSHPYWAASSPRRPFQPEQTSARTRKLGRLAGRKYGGATKNAENEAA